MSELPPAVRTLPMSFDEFYGDCTIESAQQWFLTDLSTTLNGHYRCRRNLLSPVGTVVLFQCDAQIIASGVLAGYTRFENPDKDGYTGTLNFDANTIIAFYPIDSKAFRDIWPTFKRFNQTPQNLDTKYYPKFQERLIDIRYRQSISPVSDEEKIAVPPERVRVLINQILRDTELARHVKELHNFECQICKHTITLPNGKRYAEAHHLRPLGQQHNGLDVIGNLICVCPNHHTELDYAVTALSLTSLNGLEKHKIDQKYIEYHNQRVK